MVDFFYHEENIYTQQPNDDLIFLPFIYLIELHLEMKLCRFWAKEKRKKEYNAMNNKFNRTICLRILVH